MRIPLIGYISKKKVAEPRIEDILVPRLARECAQLIAIYHTETNYGYDNSNEGKWWVYIKKWPLPAGLNSKVSDIILIIPKDYPVKPPTKIFIPKEVKSLSGEPLENFLPVMLEAAPEYWQGYCIPTHYWRAGDDMERVLRTVQTIIQVSLYLKKQ
ncbi:MAG: E2/UBC family protein [Candidatus Eremiobacterota bacterium]